MSNVIIIGVLSTCASLAPHASSQTPSKDDARAIATEGYLFGFPLVLMDATRQKMTAVASASQAGAPLNQFCHLSEFPDASFVDVVSPNADTLYSTAWLDLAKEPIVLSVPDTNGRYYLMPMLDAWTNVFASPGKRTTGTTKADFAICGPDWKGSVPKGVNELRAPTQMVWIIGRTQTNGKKDYDAVHGLQAQYKLTPLSAFGKDYAPPASVSIEASADKQTSPVDLVAKLDGTAFFTRLAALMKTNPPATEDEPIIAKLAQIGVVPGQPFNADPALAAELDAGVKAASQAIIAEAHKRGGASKGWMVSSGIGQYGTDYAKRAGVAYFGLGANLDADAMYPSARHDLDGEPLDGANRYVIHFEKAKTPPVQAFWSVTMYNDKQGFVDNPLDRYAIGDRDELKPNADGTIDLYIQNESPGADKESNWLPAPKGSFNLIMRMYWPKDEALKGEYAIPPLRKVK